MKKAEKAMEFIKKSKTTDKLDKAYEIIQGLTKALVKSKKIHGMILQSPTGLGKTYNCMKTLTKEGLNIDDDFVVLRGYTTPLEMYQFLYNNKDKIILMDDITTVFKSERALGILLSALYHPSNTRIVNYLSSSYALDVPEQFEFTGKIIWCVNNLPKNIDNIKSRCIYYKFNFKYKQLMELMGEIAKIKNIPSDIVKYIKKITDESYRLDLRLPEKIYELKKHLPNSWKEKTKKLLKIEQDELLKTVKECLDNHETVKNAVKEFNKKTGYSRSTFFRKKRKLR